MIFYKNTTFQTPPLELLEGLSKIPSESWHYGYLTILDGQVVLQSRRTYLGIHTMRVRNNL